MRAAGRAGDLVVARHRAGSGARAARAWTSPLDLAAVAARGRRRWCAARSGGGPVLWDADLLALDVVLPRGHRSRARRGARLPLARGGLRRRVANVWGGRRGGGRRASGRGRIGRTPGRRRDACFGGLSPFEVTAGGRKVVGLSQARRAGRGTLLQAGVPLRLDARRLARLLGPRRRFRRGPSRPPPRAWTSWPPGVTADDARRRGRRGGRAPGAASPWRRRPDGDERDAVAAVVAEGLGGARGGA